MFTDRLCALPLDAAVRFAAKQVDWLKERMAPSSSGCDEPTDSEADGDATHEPAGVINAHDDDAHDGDASGADADADADAVADENSLADVEPAIDTGIQPEEDTTQNDASQDDDDNREHSDDSSADKHEPSAREPVTASSSTITATVPEASRLVPETPRPLTPDVIAHMQLVSKHLRFPEILQAQALINNTTVAERNGWIARLMALAPADAAALVRAELARRAGH